MTDPSLLLRGMKTRAATFENPTAESGAGGGTANGRKGAPSKLVMPGERVRLAAVSGPGRVTHFWATFSSAAGPTTPQVARSQLLEVTYDGTGAASVSVPAPDFFGVVHGMRTPVTSTLAAVNEALGYASRIPLPFGQSIEIDWTNRSTVPITLYYQVDLLLGSQGESGYLHAAFRRDNPTTPGLDFVMLEGIEGPGRFLGVTGGVRVFDPSRWWGEGEVKMFIDDDDALPTVCGTGTEDYLDSAWGLGTFSAPETGAPLVMAAEGDPDHFHRWVSFYRWHLSDPVVFERSLRVTIQQIGMASFVRGGEDAWAEFRSTHDAAGHGWVEQSEGPVIGYGLYERSDDWCATGFVYAERPQPVSPCDLDVAIADLPTTRKGLRLISRSGR